MRDATKSLHRARFYSELCIVHRCPGFQDDQFRREFDLSGYGREGGAGLKMGGGGELFKYEPREEKMMAGDKM